MRPTCSLVASSGNKLSVLTPHSIGIIGCPGKTEELEVIVILDGAKVVSTDNVLFHDVGVIVGVVTVSVSGVSRTYQT